MVDHNTVREESSARRPYRTPRLTRYGKLTDLTNGGNENDTDALAASGPAGFGSP